VGAARRRRGAALQAALRALNGPGGRPPAIRPRALAALAVVLAFAIVGCGSGAPEMVPVAAVAPVAAVVPGAEPSASAPTPDPPPGATPAPVLVPLVPVTGFWSAERSITRSALAAALAGTGAYPRPVLVSAADLPSLTRHLGVQPGRNVRALAPADVRAGLAASPGALGILRAEDVNPAVRALEVGGIGLFGGRRVRDLARWPLPVAEPTGTTASTFLPAAAWTLVAGGDVMLDRYVYKRIVLDGLGATYPWTGGTARITSRYCCGYPGFRIVKGKRVANNGAVRSLLRDADVAMVNLEGPAPDDFRYHTSGFTLFGNRLVASSMGNLVFGMTHDERTQEGVFVELTFTGTRLAQITLHPTLIVGSVQPNILLPGGGGTTFLTAIHRASARLGGP
jgi:hypothetical protein